MTSVIEIRNPRICEFYNVHKCFDVESMNLMLIDFLEKSMATSQSSSIIAQPQNIFQINELHTSYALFQDSITQFNKSLLTVFLQYKNEYIAEFKSIFDSQSKQVFLDNNQTFILKIHKLLFSHMPESIFKSKYTQVYDKIMGTTKQFLHIINANVDTIFNKSDFQSIYTTYIQNFEINSSHLIQSIQQIFTEFLHTKQESVTKISSELSNQSTSASYSLYSKLNYELNDFVHNFKQHTQKNCQFETAVSHLFPTATVQIQTCSLPDTSLLLLRDHRPTIFISSIANKERNVNAQEVKDFQKLIQTHNCHGILISQHTGITSKPNFHIEIVNKNILVYIHNAAFSPDKIQISTDIIDTIYHKLSDFSLSPDNKLAIPKDVLDDINREYQTFIASKETLVELIKESNKKILSQINDVSFPSLDKYLSTRYSTHKKQGFVCDLCNNFTVPTLKGLAAHKRGCNRKHTNCATSSSVSIMKTNTHQSTDPPTLIE